jgi:ABC-2 type transport system ATP-binding protein
VAKYGGGDVADLPAAAPRLRATARGETGEPAIRVDGLRVNRGGREILHAVSLTAATGAITGLLGPSGCGKTTLMRAMVGVQVVHGGVVEVLGLPAGTPALRRQVGYVTQAPSVYGDLTTRENLRYFARVLGAPAARVDAAIATVDLGEHADRVANSLSGGEQTRVSLATALLAEPRLLVLDEPTVGLDPLLRRDLWGTFKALAAEGVTLLVSSHVMDEASRCDRLLLMRDGRLLADETPEALLRRTKSTDLEQAFLHLIRTEAAA